MQTGQTVQGNGQSAASTRLRSGAKRYNLGKNRWHWGTRRADLGERATGCYARYQLNPKTRGNGGIEP